jgi:hypothetical protein
MVRAPLDFQGAPRYTLQAIPTHGLQRGLRGRVVGALIFFMTLQG